MSFCKFHVYPDGHEVNLRYANVPLRVKKLSPMEAVLSKSNLTESDVCLSVQRCISLEKKTN